jgi:asparagine synthase (glutamine-hydrolysing)
MTPSEEQMSVLFGSWTGRGEPSDPGQINEVLRLLGPYAPEGFAVRTEGSLTLVFGAFHTCSESRRESQPHRTAAGDLLLWDGRLDNRKDLIASAAPGVAEPCDLAIVSAAYERWGTASFAQLLGDWALSVWHPSDRSVVLARDFLGVRPLFYAVGRDRLVWSSLLDPRVLLRDSKTALSEEYVAGWLSMFPKASLTPYEGIQAVPPGSYVTISDGRVLLRKYWEFDPEKRTRYPSDSDYEDHFRSVFRQSILRRVRSDGPILAELSGGMDSSSIVCMSDRVISEGLQPSPGVDTVSLFDETEPHWDERPYFRRVEEQRSRRGLHIDVNAPAPPACGRGGAFFPLPSYGDPGRSLAKRFSECILSGPYRVVLSGTGGDEATGGLPTPLPELADLLARMKFAEWGRQLVTWSLSRRKPALKLLFHLFGVFSPRRLPSHSRLPWLERDFAERNRLALAGYPERIRFFGALPSFQMNLLALEAMRRQLSCTPLPAHPHYERRYPFLDRDFLEFCYSLPREQLVRPSERRSLLRRAMKGIVPREILERKRKAFVVRRLISDLQDASGEISSGKASLLSASYGIIRQDEFLRALRNIASDPEPPLVPLLRAIALEAWLPGAGPYLTVPGSKVALLPREAAAPRGSPFLGRVDTTQKGGG